MEPRYIDAHGHPHFAAYGADREEVLARALQADVGMVAVGTDFATSKAALDLAERHDHVWATIGMHPIFSGESHNDPLETGDKEGRRAGQEFEKERFLELAMHPKVVAIGECGLDYFHSAPEDIAKQRQAFIEQVKIANEAGKPLMLHVRNGKDGASAYMEALGILKEHAKVKADFHFFAGTLDDLKTITSAGFYVSFTGVITFAKNYEELVRAAPIDRIMIETDCPYVAPVPHRGKRNEPVFVIEVAKKLAELRGEDPEAVRDQILKNTKGFFGV